MRYRYDHTATLARHGITICQNCDGRGYINTARDIYDEFLEDCPCCEDGWDRSETIGLAWKRVRTHSMEIAA